MRQCIAPAGCLLFALPAVAQEDLLIDGFEVVNQQLWEKGRQKEISFSFDDEHVTEGDQALHIRVAIDHRQAGDVKGRSYPTGWPSQHILSHYRAVPR